jgi:hypothetical protein
LSFTIPCGASEETLESILNAVPSIIRGVGVSRAGTGGPGMAWTITFYDYGNRGALTLGSLAGLTAGTTTTNINLNDNLHGPNMDVFTIIQVSHDGICLNLTSCV